MSRPRRRRPPTITELIELYEDAERCAQAAGLRYVSHEQPGIRRLKRGGGFTYRDAEGKPIDAEVRVRIQSLAIPPAWTDVWICAEQDGHLLAIGTDEKGRRQYRYHDDWRSFRDLLNFYRLVDFGPRLPSIRADVAAQLRRRTLDRPQVIAAMLRIVDRCGLRVGSEEYAEENASYGLSTLKKRHVRVQGPMIRFDFPAKSGKQATVSLRDPAVVRIVTRLAAQRSQYLFTLDRQHVSADELNDRLAELTGAHVTAKDFRTWHGTRVAFAALRAHLPPDDAEQRVLDAIDRASEFLNNTRAVARAHYVHPHVVGAYLDGSFEDVLRRRRPVRLPELDADERCLLPFLGTLLDERLHGL